MPIGMVIRGDDSLLFSVKKRSTYLDNSGAGLATSLLDSFKQNWLSRMLSTKLTLSFPLEMYGDE